MDGKMALAAVVVVAMAAALFMWGGRFEERPETLSISEIMEELEENGTAATEGGEVWQVFFEKRGRIIKINNEDVQVFEYENAMDAERQARLVSQDGSSVGTTMIAWVAAPHFYKRANIIAIYVGDDGKTIRALEEVFGRQFAGRESESNDVEFVTIEKGAYSGLSERGNYAIRSAEEWKEVWGSARPLPEGIDFSDSMLIAAFQGYKTSGGFSVEITRIVENEENMEVFVKETVPGEGCEVTLSETAPYHIVKTQNTGKKVVFLTEEEITDCA